MPGTDFFLTGRKLPRLPIPDGATLVLGRSPIADAVVPDRSISRRHAELRRVGDVVTVRDLGTTNGTFVDGAQVGDAPVVLPHGSLLEVGDARLTLARSAADVLPGDETVPTAHIRRRELAGTSVKEFLGTDQRGSGFVEVESDALSGWISYYRNQFEDAETSDGRRGQEALRALLAVRAGRCILYTTDGTPRGSQKLKRVKEDRLLDRLLDGDDGPGALPSEG